MQLDKCLAKKWIPGGIPPRIANMMQLESLDLSYNQLSGEFPPAMRGDVISRGARPLLQPPVRADTTIQPVLDIPEHLIFGER